MSSTQHRNHFVFFFLIIIKNVFFYFHPKGGRCSMLLAFQWITEDFTKIP